jgi:hypothetical protein
LNPIETGVFFDCAKEIFRGMTSYFFRFGKGRQKKLYIIVNMQEDKGLPRFMQLGG